MGVLADLVERLLARGIDHQSLVDIVAAFEERIPALDDQAERRRAADRERKRAMRAAMSAESDTSAESADNLSPSPFSPTPPKPLTPIHTPGTPKGVPAPTGREINQAFDELWAAYPKRKGSNPREPARQKFRAALKSGTPPEQILAGAKAYAAEQRELGKVGTEFVAQLVVWLNQKRWADYAGEATEAVVPADDWIFAPLSRRYRREYGADPPMRDGGGAFPAEWVSYARGQSQQVSG